MCEKFKAKRIKIGVGVVRRHIVAGKYYVGKIFPCAQLKSINKHLCIMSEHKLKLESFQNSCDKGKSLWKMSSGGFWSVENFRNVEEIFMRFKGFKTDV